MKMSQLKIVLRILWKHRLFTSINILSLTLCLTSVIAMLLLVSKLVTFDGFHEQGDRLYGVMEGNKTDPLSPGTTFPIAERLHADFPEVEMYSRTLTWDTYLLGSDQGDWSITPDFVDPDFLKMFTFPLRYGDAATALSDVNGIVLSQKMATRIFGDINPVGQEVSWNDSLRLTVTGVLEQLPGATSLQFSALMSMQWLYNHTPYFKQMTQEGSRFVTSYLLLSADADRKTFEGKLMAAAPRYYTQVDKEPQLGIILFKDITSRYEPMLPYYVGGLRLIVLFLVLIAGVNLVNLTSASALYRIREIGVRSVLGSLKRQVIGLFLLETGVVVAFALSISLALIPPIIRYFNAKVLAEFSVDFYWQFDYPVVVQVCIIFVLLALVAAGIPAIRLLRTPVALSLKGQANAQPKQSMLQQGLIVLQFSLAVVFVFLTVVVQQQMHYIKRVDLGFEKDQVMVIDSFIGFKDREKAYQVLDHAIRGLAQFPEVEHYSAGQNIPGHYRNWFNSMHSSDKEVYCRVSHEVDSAYFPTYGIRFLAGTNFHDEKAVAKRNTVILNRTAAETFGWTPDQAIGQQINDGDVVPDTYTVIGVTEDFNYRALTSGIESLAHFGSDAGAVSMLQSSQFISIRINPAKARPIIQYLRETFAQLPATGTFSYSYSNEIFNKQYERENMVMTLIAMAGAIAIFIACAGTFGLAAQLARLRTKEIGVRKVLGASIADLVRLLSFRFVVLVGIALLVALPVGYLGASLWLEEFPYRIGVGWWMFVLTAVMVLTIAVATVSFQAIKASLANPVDSLKDE